MEPSWRGAPRLRGDEAISLILARSGRLLHSVRNDGRLEHIVPSEKQFYTRHGEERSDEAISLMLPGSGRLLHSVRNDGRLEHIVPSEKQFYTRHGEEPRGFGATKPSHQYCRDQEDYFVIPSARDSS